MNQQPYTEGMAMVYDGWHIISHEHVGHIKVTMTRYYKTKRLWIFPVDAMDRVVLYKPKKELDPQWRILDNNCQMTLSRATSLYLNALLLAATKVSKD